MGWLASAYKWAVSVGWLASAYKWAVSVETLKTLARNILLLVHRVSLYHSELAIMGGWILMVL